MKKIYLHLFTLGLLVALISTPGCESKKIQIVTTTESPPNAIYTAAAATLSAQSTEAAKSHPPQTPTLTSTLTPTPVYAPKWEISPADSNFALIVLDYETLKFKAAYFEVFEPCSINGPLKSEEDLVSQAGKVLKRTGPIPGLQHVGDFALFEIYPGDIGGAAVLDPCTGQVLFAGSIAWLGGGAQIYPVHPIVPVAFENENGPIMQPQRIDVITSPASTNVGGFEAAWNSVQSLNLVHDFASYQYSVFIYLYAPSVGAFYPPDAEWLIFLHRGSSQ